MASKNVANILAITLTCLIMANHATATRDLIAITERVKTSGGGEGGGGSGGEGPLVDCWNALMELKSCSNEIIAFFLNGQADIGPDCCKAIGIITRNCWPAMLTSLGFTAEEGNILRGYCDATAAAATTTTSAPPAPAPLPNSTKLA